MDAEGRFFAVIFVIAQLIISSKATGVAIHNVYEGYQITSSVLSSTRADSVQNCIHRCKRRSDCRLAGVKQITNLTAEVHCVFAAMQCHEKAEDKISESEGWSVYQLYKPAMFFFAFNNAKLCLNYAPANNHYLVFTAACSQLFCHNPDGIYHVTSHKCITVKKQTPMFLQLSGSCDETSPLEQVAGPAVQQKSTGYHIHPEQGSSGLNQQEGGKVLAYPTGTFPFFFKDVE